MKFRKPEDRLLFYTCFSTLLKAGIPFEKSLKILFDSAEQSGEKTKMEVCGFLHYQICKGVAFSEAIKMSEAFPPYAASALKAAEESGKMDEVLMSLADAEERDRQLKNTLKSALREPIMVSGVGFLIVLVIARFLGRLEGVFQTVGIETPAYLKFMIGVGHLVVDPTFICALVVIGFLAYRKLADPKFQRRLRNFTKDIGVPVFSRAMVLTSNIRFCRLLGMQLQAGCSLLPALVRSLSSTDDPVLIQHANREIPDSIVARVVEGEELSRALESSGYFSKHLISMLKVAEEHGSVVRTLTATAEFLQSELDYRMKLFATLVEPLFLVMTGIGVGLVAVGTFVPLLQVMNI